jgi:hypothetical protein|nr:MAG TPA: hypothetical protein [Caudoviricetes sp.]
MSNVYDMNGKKKVVMEEKEDEDITYKEIMKIIIENATEEGCHQIFSYGGIDSIVEDLNENKITPNQAREKLCLPKIKSAIEKENDRLLELCMFALLPKRIYNHELADKTKEAFKNIIKKNINEDTYTIRNEIVRYWDGKTKK